MTTLYDKIFNKDFIKLLDSFGNILKKAYLLPSIYSDYIDIYANDVLGDGYIYSGIPIDLYEKYSEGQLEVGIFENTKCNFCPEDGLNLVKELDGLCNGLNLKYPTIDERKDLSCEDISDYTKCNV